jgi:hypothetical protein
MCRPVDQKETIMRVFLMVALLLLAPLVSAAEPKEPKSSSLPEMVEQQVALRAELAGDPQDLTPRQVGIMRKAQAEFFRLVDGKTSMDQLAIHEKVELENALEKINAQLLGTNRAAADQNVCWREKTSGTRLHVTRCGTQEEIDDAREGAQRFLLKPKICEPPGCGV